MGQQQNDPWVTVGYEVEMFRRLRRLFESGNPQLVQLPWEIRMAATESALLHARQLADILLSRGKDDTDINLTTILPEFVPARLEELRALYGGRNDGICRILNKYAMHPSTLRTDSYDYTTVLTRLGAIFEHIIREIEHKRQSKSSDWMGGGKRIATLVTDNRAVTNVAEIVECYDGR